MEVVDRGEGVGCEFFGLEEVVEVSEGKVLAGGAGTVGLDGAKVVDVAPLLDFKSPLLGEEHAVPGCAGGVGAVECIDA